MLQFFIKQSEIKHNNYSTADWRSVVDSQPSGVARVNGKNSMCQLCMLREDGKTVNNLYFNQKPEVLTACQTP